MSCTQAIRQQLQALGRQGVTIVRYNNAGRRPKRDLVDVATRRAVLTGVNQTAAELQLMRMEEQDWDLVETTAHLGARPSHADWQGQVFSRSGGSKYPDFYTSTGYGEGWGLCGWNCRHNFFPFFAGASRRAYTDGELSEMQHKTVTVDGEEITQYKATQIQRRQEVQIRSLKRELTTIDAGINATRNEALKRELQQEFDLTSLTLKTKEKEQVTFVRQAGLQRQREREQVVGHGRSVAQKAVWGARRQRK